MTTLSSFIVAAKHSVFALAFAVAGASSAANANIALTDQEKEAAELLHARGLTRVMILNEKKGRMLIVEQGAVIATMPAITGKTIGDSLDRKKDVTPAGMYPLTPSPSLYHPSSSITYYDFPDSDFPGHKVASTIHRVVRGREAALAGNDPAAKRISNGCINVFDADFRKVADYAMTSLHTVVYPDGQKGPRASWLYILPESNESGKVLETLRQVKSYRFE